jgi:hypothetical protein
MPHQSHPSWLDNSNYTWRRVQLIASKINRLLRMVVYKIINLDISDDLYIWCLPTQFLACPCCLLRHSYAWLTLNVLLILCSLFNSLSHRFI